MCIKIVNFVPFRLEWLIYLVPIQKTEQIGTDFISLRIPTYSRNSARNVLILFCRSVSTKLFSFFLFFKSIFFL
jgi:hypothetical protein